ncbi:MAG: hypothetical protein WDA25_07190 [Paracoccaceae bacterium]
MKKFIIATVAAAALTMGGLAPASAQSRSNEAEVAGVLAGALALYMFGRAMDDRKDQAAKAPAPQRPNQSHHHRPQPSARPAPIPAVCAYEHRGHRAEVARYIPQNCLRSNMRGANALPDRCQVTLRDRRGNGRYYDSTCLSRAGYHFEAPRRR